MFFAIPPLAGKTSSSQGLSSDDRLMRVRASAIGSCTLFKGVASHPSNDQPDIVCCLQFRSRGFIFVYLIPWLSNVAVKCSLDAKNFRKTLDFIGVPYGI
jgi:hypothetical protein